MLRTRGPQPIPLMERQMNSTELQQSIRPNLDTNYIGMDVHSDNVVVCVRRNALKPDGQIVGKTIKSRKIEIKKTKDDLIAFLSKYATNQPHIMTAESTFNWYWIADIAEDNNWNFRLADPCTVSQANIKASNDETDAEYLADRLRLGSLKCTKVLPRKMRGIRDLMRHRIRVMQEVSDKKIRLSNLFHNHCAHPLHGTALMRLKEKYAVEGKKAIIEAGIPENGTEHIIGDLLSGLMHAESRLAAVEEELYPLVYKLEEFRDSCNLLMSSIKGCGRVLSTIIVTEIGDISRFRTMGDFVSYCRLAPTSKLSNGKSKGQGNAKNGNAYLSWAFTELATLMARFNIPVENYLIRKALKRKLRVIAVRSLAAKLARCVYQILKKKEPFILELSFPEPQNKALAQETKVASAPKEETPKKKSKTQERKTKKTHAVVNNEAKAKEENKPSCVLTSRERLCSCETKQVSSQVSGVTSATVCP